MRNNKTEVIALKLLK